MKGAAEIAAGIREGRRNALARMISWAENDDPRFPEALAAIYPSVGGSWRGGITGPPGAGKSTLATRAANRLAEDGFRVVPVRVDEGPDPATQGRAATLKLFTSLATAFDLETRPDAAAALHALCELWEIDSAQVDLRTIAAELGADVPVCLAGRPSLIRGRGEDLLPAPPLPPCHFVLANPGVALATAEVFARHDGAGSGNAPLEGPFPDTRALARALSERRNDLEPAARALAPAIGETLRLIGAAPGCLLTRMSGSGATCFGLFENSIDAEATAEIVRRAEPNWWIEATAMNDA